MAERVGLIRAFTAHPSGVLRTSVARLRVLGYSGLRADVVSAD